MNKSALPLLLMTVLFGAASSASAAVEVRHDPESPTAGIQEAVDALPKEGGAVFIPSGRYLLRRPVFLPSNVMLYGEGYATLLEADADYSSGLAQDAVSGGRAIRVADPAPFRPRDAVLVLDEGMGDSQKATLAHVVEVRGDEVLLDSPLRLAYRLRRNARVVHIFSLIRSRGQISNVTLRDLRLVGSLRKNHQGVHSWPYGSAVALRGENIRLLNLDVQDTPGDAILLARAGRFMVRDCRLINNASRGIHIGDNNTDIVISGNIIEKAGNFGIYFCNGCRRVNVVGNVIASIGVYETDRGPQEVGYADPYRMNTNVSGIGGLGGGGLHDKFDNITGNVIHDSRGSGISFLRWPGEVRPGECINVSGNTIYDIRLSALYIFAADTVNVSDNLIINSGVGVSILKSVGCNIRNNLLRDCPVGVELASDEEELPSRLNVVTGNTFIRCGEGTRVGSFASDNVLDGNVMIKGSGE